MLLLLHRILFGLNEQIHYLKKFSFCFFDANGWLDFSIHRKDVENLTLLNKIWHLLSNVRFSTLFWRLSDKQKNCCIIINTASSFQLIGARHFERTITEGNKISKSNLTFESYIKTIDEIIFLVLHPAYLLICHQITL